MDNTFKKVAPIVLAIIGSIGVVGTSVLVAKETPKANEKLKEINETDAKKKILKQGKTIFKSYWPAILCGVGTIGSVAASTIISKKTEASLIATATVIGQGWNKYKWKVKDILGPDTNKKIMDAISKDEYEDLPKDQSQPAPNKKLYWEEHLGYFECEEASFLAAITDLNQRLHVPDADDNGTFYWTSLKIFAQDARAELRDPDKLKACENIGWTSDYLLEVYGPQGVWIHPHYTNVYDKETNKLLYTRLDFWEETIVLVESEKARWHYKSRKDFEHEAECDLNASASVDEYITCTKPDCNMINDDLSRVISSDPAQAATSTDIYEEEEDK